MPPVLKPEQIIKVIEKNGFRFVKQKGSHRKYKKGAVNMTAPILYPLSLKRVPTEVGGCFPQLILAKIVANSALVTVPEGLSLLSDPVTTPMPIIKST